MKLRTNILLTLNEKMALTKIQAYAITLPKVTPRIAGGWVRDKLLGKDSNDIDITLDTISGIDFANGLKNFYGWTGPVGKIKANPDKSKHLETAVMKINGISIDFLSLRKETYGNTRIPQVIACTAKEDAFRRDLTINSLFYNLLTEKIEDFTEKGLDDLKNEIIRTPLTAHQTLIDDPLRILRIVRFAIRLNFQIDCEILNAFNEVEIQRSLKQKVSSERIRIEIFKILENERFLTALKIFATHDLIGAIFKIKIDVDITNLIRVHNNYLNLKKYMNFDDFIVRFYVLLVFNGAVPVKNSFSNFLMVKNSLSCNKQVFAKVKRIEKNLVLLKKVSEKMSDEDAVFLLRHMKEDFETSMAIYLMASEYRISEISDFFKGIGHEQFHSLINNSHIDLCNQKNNVNSNADENLHSVTELSVEEAAKMNKYLIFHLLNIAKKYEVDLFHKTFPFDGEYISKWLEIDQSETSFYLEMAKVQFITNSNLTLENLPDKLKEIQRERRIDGFKLFYLTDKF
ncbi:tRNA nucleotidyltransferase/poly(A) polymerase [Pseudoloma neurophilia]|uniref:tRNA nucleotidyltransferase/poly(A) polymerase n=1 Tax=Pseudoloma neurophilia TaxID=146866 RepID=A0A0R0M6C7_9MICR|nr:tRNA nucleotidyltransferase/poly(A) polymerase [Pseudoloma neurophilia]